MKRRDVIRSFAGASGLAALAPRSVQQLLNPLSASRAAAQSQAPTPKRLLILFTPNGVTKDQWFPDLPENEETLTATCFRSTLTPLAVHRDKLLVFGAAASAEAHHRAANGYFNADHHQHGLKILNDTSQGHSSVCVLTGVVPVSGGNENFVPGGPSIDQFIAERIGGTTRFRSLELGVGVGQNPFAGYNRMSFRGAGQPGLRAQDSPLGAFNEVFANVQPPQGGAQEDPAVAAQRLRRRSILDYARGQMLQARARLGGEDVRRLDQHEAAIRELELTLADMNSSMSNRACSPSSSGAVAEANVQQVLPAQFRIAEQAFSCDLTRVATIMVGGGLSKLAYPWLGDAREHHAISHEGPSQALAAIDRWHAQQLADSIARLSAIPEGNGTLMDHTLIVWVNENSNGNAHSHYNMPFLMAGSSSGYFRTGRYIRLPTTGRSHNDLWVSVANAMGMGEVQRFGGNDLCAGPIMELRA